MCRLVIRNRDKTNPDSKFLDAECMKAGMVVSILDDGQSLGAKGDLYDGWTVLEMKGVPKEEMEHLLERQQGDKLVTPLLGRRQWKVDIAGHDAALAAAKAELAKTDADKAATLTADKTLIATMTSVAPILIDADVIG